jgi:putative addiction module CopG family antidote
MTMSVSIPNSLRAFIEEELATGEYSSEAELVVKALEVYRELKKRHHELREDVQRSIAQAERGEVKPFDMDAIKAGIRDDQHTGS